MGPFFGGGEQTLVPTIQWELPRWNYGNNQPARNRPALLPPCHSCTASSRPLKSAQLQSCKWHSTCKSVPECFSESKKNHYGNEMKSPNLARGGGILTDLQNPKFIFSESLTSSSCTCILWSCTTFHQVRNFLRKQFHRWSCAISCAVSNMDFLGITPHEPL